MAKSNSDFVQEAKQCDAGYPQAPVDSSAVPATALSIDWDLYAEYLDDCDLSDDQKQELIETLWHIVVSFVDLGFGVGEPQNSDMEMGAISGAVAETAERNAQEMSPILAKNMLSFEAISKTIQDDKSAGDASRSKAEKEES